MQYFLARFQSEIASGVKGLLQAKTPVVVEPANPKFGADFAVPCFAFAKEFGRDPQAMATQIASEFRHKDIDKIEAKAGFANIWLKSDSMAAALHNDLEKVGKEKLRYGESREGKGKVAIVEFPSPNMAKPFSVGHLRASNQGWAIYNLVKAAGYQAVSDNHLGDWGAPFGKWVVGFLRFSSEEKLNKDGIYELARVYIKVTAELKYEAEHGKHELADEIQQWLLKLEKGDPEATAYSKRFNEISLTHMHQVMHRLGIKTDEEFGESFYIAEGKRMVTELVEKGVAIKQEDGSVIVPLDEYSIKTPILIEKSNGAALYATSDMATLKYRWERWHPAKVIYLVGSEQQFHFTQVFALADKLGYKTDYEHVWWGMIDQLNDDGTRSKISSRKGTILLEELLDKAETHARQMVSQENRHQVTGEDIKKIALGAVKFTDFAQDRRTSILFDWRRMFSLQGHSGPYVQYAGVRAQAILDKLGQAGRFMPSGYDWVAEKELVLHLLRYPQVIREALEFYEPHRVAQYAYDLARLFNRYYEDVSISDSSKEIQPLRLWLLNNIKEVHASALEVLGIEVPSKM
ncbi:MAG TPA: arginine--tRNA ligase [Candidatus Saccharimonadales bacterium]|nr:arginine--tRNA ligase [Candidatus Saccharimonadales bacterium]